MSRRFVFLAIATLSPMLAACGDRAPTHADFRRYEARTMNLAWCDAFEVASPSASRAMARAHGFDNVGTAALWCAFVTYNRR